MGQVFSFKDLKTGQSVKVKGQAAGDGKIMAMTVSVEEEEPANCIESRLQAIDAERNTLRVLHRDFVVGGETIIKDLARDVVSLSDLKVGETIKMKGFYSRARGFVPEKIKVQEPRGYRIDELQGKIDQIDREAGTLTVLGMTVNLNEKTEIEGI